MSILALALIGYGFMTLLAVVFVAGACAISDRKPDVGPNGVGACTNDIANLDSRDLPGTVGKLDRAKMGAV
jgi:hypothetical protein